MVGAPCGVMDQVAVALGSPGAVLPILCRPASPWPAVMLPPDLEIVGWPSGAAHDVSGAPYRRARAAAFMGKRIVEGSEKRSWSWVSELPAAAATRLPEEIGGAEILERWGETGDVITAVQSEVTYPVRASVLFGIGEHARSRGRAGRSPAGRARAVGRAAQRQSRRVRGHGTGSPGGHGNRREGVGDAGRPRARASGGGCGGTIVVMCERRCAGPCGRAHPLRSQRPTVSSVPGAAPRRRRALPHHQLRRDHDVTSAGSPSASESRSSTQRRPTSPKSWRIGGERRQEVPRFRGVVEADHADVPGDPAGRRRAAPGSPRAPSGRWRRRRRSRSGSWPRRRPAA